MSTEQANERPFDGRPTWRVARTLRDGTTITIRPVVPEDREELRRGFREASPRTRYLRFFGVVGLGVSALLTLLILAQSVAGFVIDPCQ